MKIVNWYLDNFRYKWSNFKHDKRFLKLAPRSTPFAPNMVKKYADSIKPNFNWTVDNASQLFEYIDSPEHCYYLITHGILNDDCDGFHAALYYKFANSVPSCMVTVMTKDIKNCHTMYMFRYGGYYFLDYSDMHGPFRTKDELIKGFNSTRLGEVVSIHYFKWLDGKWVYSDGI